MRKKKSRFEKRDGSTARIPAYLRWTVNASLESIVNMQSPWARDEHRIEGAKTEPVPSCWALLGAKVEPQACPNDFREEKKAPAKSPQEHQEGGQETPKTLLEPSSENKR